MPEEQQKKLLVCLDGSDPADEMIHYLAEIPPFSTMEIVLFMVTSRIPDCYWDLETHAPHAVSRMGEIHAWAMENERKSREYMEDAGHRLVRAGFTPTAVGVNIHTRQKGIARDIIKEAGNRYHALVVGRKGTSRLKDLVLGSVTMKLLERIGFLPLIVVGKRPKAEKVLLAMDGSEGCMRAVDFVGRTLSDCRVCDLKLLHIIRGENPNCIREGQERITPVFDMARRHLIECGFQSDQITTRVITRAKSRAAAIVEEADSGEYGTIVVGRRGLSKTQEFFIGRVSSKVVQIGRNKAIWVVS